MKLSLHILTVCDTVSGTPCLQSCHFIKHDAISLMVARLRNSIHLVREFFFLSMQTFPLAKIQSFFSFGIFESPATERALPLASLYTDGSCLVAQHNWVPESEAPFAKIYGAFFFLGVNWTRNGLNATVPLSSLEHRSMFSRWQCAVQRLGFTIDQN